MYSRAISTSQKNHLCSGNQCRGTEAYSGLRGRNSVHTSMWVADLFTFGDLIVQSVGLCEVGVNWHEINRYNTAVRSPLWTSTTRSCFYGSFESQHQDTFICSTSIYWAPTMCHLLTSLPCTQKLEESSYNLAVSVPLRMMMRWLCQRDWHQVQKSLRPMSLVSAHKTGTTLGLPGKMRRS